MTLVTGRIPTGVLEALKGQARIATRAGLPLDYLLVNPERDELMEAGLRLTRYRSSRFGHSADRFLKSRRLSSVRLLDDFDVIFVRYTQGLDVDPLAIFRTTRAKIVTVHHTKDLEEMVSGTLTPAKALRWAMERVNGTRILRHVDGIVGVTDEIREYELRRAGREVPSATVANGIDVLSINPTGFVPFDGRSLRLFFVGSDPSPWHGIERLIRSVSAYRGHLRIVVDVVGNQARSPGSVEHFERASVHFHGTLRGPDLDGLAAQANVGVGSLGAYTKRMRQGCALKTREYVARGLPFIYGYEDVDIPVDTEFAMNVPNSPELLDFDRLAEFAERVTRDRDTSRTMVGFAQERLDWTVKIRQLLDYARKL